jgi:hypothetical protein
MDERDILTSIGDMVAEEMVLRERAATGFVGRDDVQVRLRAVEVSLDQCWDLLRQRRARVEFQGDPDDAQVRSADVVEGYWS